MFLMVFNPNIYLTFFRTLDDGDFLFHKEIMLQREKICNSFYKYVMIPKKLKPKDITKKKIQWESLHEPYGDYNRVLFVTNDMILGNSSNYFK